jgi:hypothetical protein
MRSPFLGALWFLACIVCRPARAHDQESVRAALRARAQAVDHIKVTYTWDPRRLPLDNDPFDPNNWLQEPNWAHERGPLYQCEFWLVRPDFRWHRTSALPYDRDEIATWIDGESQTRCFSPTDATCSVVIDSDRWKLHGPIPVLTPFELQICDVQDSILQLLERDELQIENENPDRVVLTGHPTQGSKPTLWTVRATLDPSREWLPVEVYAETPHSVGSPKKIRWTVRTIDSLPVRGVHAIREAIIALDNGGLDKLGWQIYHYVASSIVADDTLTTEDLRVEIPAKNLKYLNRVTGLERQTDERGEATFEHVRTPEEAEEIQRAIAMSAAMGDEARKITGQRQRMFYWLVSSAAAATITAAGVWLWLRHRPAPV